jgi:hypothetical protein
MRKYPSYFNLNENTVSFQVAKDTIAWTWALIIDLINKLHE